jgi:hypothetical protein
MTHTYTPAESALTAAALVVASEQKVAGGVLPIPGSPMFVAFGDMAQLRKLVQAAPMQQQAPLAIMIISDSVTEHDRDGNLTRHAVSRGRALTEEELNAPVVPWTARIKPCGAVQGEHQGGGPVCGKDWYGSVHFCATCRETAMQFEIADWRMAQPIADVSALRDAVAESLRGNYYCGRVWSAWGFGTMSEADFSPSEEVDECIDQVMDAVRPFLAPAADVSAPTDELAATDAMVDAWLKFSSKATYLQHPKVTPYEGIVNGDSPEAWFRRYLKAAINEVLPVRAAAPVSGQAAQPQPAIQTPGEPPMCPACHGYGESSVLDGGGPDAQEIPCNCPHCNGAGTLEDAYRGVVTLLAAEHKKYMDACAKLYFAPPAPAPAIQAQPLTDADILAALATTTHEPPVRLPPGWLKFARAIERHLTDTKE